MKFISTADDLIERLLGLDGNVCILDSCGVGYLGSHLLIAGIEPVTAFETSDDPQKILKELDRLLSGGNAAIFTLSYDLGRKLLNIDPTAPAGNEPEVFVAVFDALIIHDYADGTTRLTGNPDKFAAIEGKLREASSVKLTAPRATSVRSNFSKQEYLDAIATIQERIRCGDTYQTNLTQQLTAELSPGLTAETIFARVRRDHPAQFASFIRRKDSTVVSASPERFFSVRCDRILTSPIKGTRPRGTTPDEDNELRNELMQSEKDRAENTMIVDLLRNDIGLVCEFGSVKVERLCDLEEHPTFFHLVSTVTGELRGQVRLSDLINAVFPCGSITGAPKVSTMGIIDEIENARRGLSMGAIGYYAPPKFGLPAACDLSVAIRTMVVRDRIATFNVGGGITIDSDPESEYEESLVKAKALLAAINGTILA